MSSSNYTYIIHRFIDTVQNLFIIPRIVIRHDTLLLLEYRRNCVKVVCNRFYSRKMYISIGLENTMSV